MKDTVWTRTFTFRIGRRGAPVLSEIFYLALIAVMAYGAFLTTVLNAVDSRQLVEQKEVSVDLF